MFPSKYRYDLEEIEDLINFRIEYTFPDES